MKILILLRHGKAEDPDMSGSDFDRKLVKKGIRLTESVAKSMNYRGLIPALIISSPAPRALETAEIFARASGIPPESIRTEQSLYEQKESEILQIVSDLDNRFDSVMLVGHDPSFSRIARRFTPEFRTSMPKSSAVAIEFDTNKWKNVVLNKGRLAAFELPEEK